MTEEVKAKALKERGRLLSKMIAKSGQEKVETWMADPDKRGIINALAYLEVK